MTPDPYRPSAQARNPQSWNRYAYTLGDPANRNDPTGLDDADLFFQDLDADSQGNISDGGGGGTESMCFQDCQPTVSPDGTLTFTDTVPCNCSNDDDNNSGACQQV